MYCTNCGKKLAEGSNFCTECGMHTAAVSTRSAEVAERSAIDEETRKELNNYPEQEKYLCRRCGYDGLCGIVKEPGIPIAVKAILAVSLFGLGAIISFLSYGYSCLSGGFFAGFPITLALLICFSGSKRYIVCPRCSVCKTMASQEN